MTEKLARHRKIPQDGKKTVGYIAPIETRAAATVKNQSPLVIDQANILMQPRQDHVQANWLTDRLQRRKKRSTPDSASNLHAISADELERRIHNGEQILNKIIEDGRYHSDRGNNRQAEIATRNLVAMTEAIQQLRDEQQRRNSSE